MMTSKSLSASLPASEVKVTNMTISAQYYDYYSFKLHSGKIVDLIFEVIMINGIRFQRAYNYRIEGSQSEWRYFSTQVERKGDQPKVTNLHRWCAARYKQGRGDVHHINHNTLDNTRENLLPLTREEHDLIHAEEENTCPICPARAEKLIVLTDEERWQLREELSFLY